jgi:non-specific serine/threonine protein kinase
MEEKSPFGFWLRKQRRALDLSRQAFADQVGCAEVTLRRIEAGTLKPSKELANIILERLGIDETSRPGWISFARGISSLPGFSPPSIKKPNSNLPAQLTTFVGREKEQADIIKRINKHRLVTLTGSGGVGKTRLSLKVGKRVLEDFADGVWLVEFASILDSLLVPRTTAIALGLRDEPQRPIIDTLCDYLREKKVLIVLDNCEHLLDACAILIDTLLKNCAQLNILTTSREALGILGEAIYRVPSLKLPDSQHLIEKIREFESVNLFEERAQLAQFDFSLTNENVFSVTQICQRLDGIPLAIELAAAKVAVFSTEQIAKQLDENFNLLTGEGRTALPRHQTLRASIDWSWSLLSESEQKVMRQLSVFAGGWTLEASKVVCDGDVLGLNESLVRKSLIVVDQKTERDTRYRFHQTIRQYASEELLQSGEEGPIRTRHLNYFLELSELAEAAMRGSSQTEWISRLKDERDNFRAALSWADQTNLEAGLYLSGRLGSFWGKFALRDGNYWLSKFLQKSESHTYPRARAKALFVHGVILYDLQQLDASFSAAKECLELYRALGDREGEVDGLLLLNWDEGLGATERMELTQRALELAESLGDVQRQMDALWQLGYLEQGKNKLMDWERAIDLARSIGNVRWLADHLSTTALELFSNGDVDLAQGYLDESDILYQQYDMNPPPRDLLSAHGQIALIRGDYEIARAYFQESAGMHLEFGNRHEYLYARVRLGYVALRRGNLDEARHIFTETARDFKEDKHTMGVVFALEGMAGVYIVVNNPDYSACLIGWADATREIFGEWRLLLDQADVDKIIAACTAKMGEAAFSDAYGKGKKLTLDEAVLYVRVES